jgi:hypothetical protein
MWLPPLWYLDRTPNEQKKTRRLFRAGGFAIAWFLLNSSTERPRGARRRREFASCKFEQLWRSFACRDASVVEKYRQRDVEASSGNPININITYEVENIINLTLLKPAHRIATCTA